MNELEKALASNRVAIEQSLPDAERELAECRARCQELEETIRRARLIMGGQVSPALGSADRPKNMREAMVMILREYPAGLKAPEIAAELERRDWYRRRDGRPADAGQVHSYAHDFPQWFVRDSGRIRLRDASD
jgi:hypothetical protein